MQTEGLWNHVLLTGAFTLTFTLARHPIPTILEKFYLSWDRFLTFRSH